MIMWVTGCLGMTLVVSSQYLESLWRLASGHLEDMVSCCVDQLAGEASGAAADSEDPRLQHEQLHRAANVRHAVITLDWLTHPVWRLMHLLLFDYHYWPLGGTTERSCDGLCKRVKIFPPIYRKNKDEVPGDIFDMLLTFTDFIAFKEMFLDYRRVSVLWAETQFKII